MSFDPEGAGAPRRNGLALLLDFTAPSKHARREVFFPVHPSPPTVCRAVKTIEAIRRGAVVEVDEESLVVRSVAWLQVGADSPRGAGERVVVVASLEPSGFLVGTRGGDGDLEIDGEGFVIDRVRHVPDELSLEPLLDELGVDLRAQALKIKPLSLLLGGA